jgi:hypothetical protein
MKKDFDNLTFTRPMKEHLNRVISFVKELKCELREIPVVVEIISTINRCHENCKLYETQYSWEPWKRTMGYYIVHCVEKDELVAILHSVMKDSETGEMKDITPFLDDRSTNIFAELSYVNDEYLSNENGWDVWEYQIIKLKGN